jgi:outer membrane immunogenic protein
MKKILYASLAIAALVATPALAADMRAPVRKAPAAMPAPIYTWTGCYIGGNVGWGRTETRITDLEGFDDGRHTADGVVGGGQVGCDYQFASNWVIGVQGLFDAAGFSGRHVSPIEEDETFRSRTRWFATLTGRLGFLATPNLLLYGKAGWGWVNQRLTVTDDSGTVFTADHSNFNGPDVGAGFEYLLTPNWSLWVEWDHIFARDKTVNFVGFEPERVRRDFDKVLVGLNWRFGAGPGRAAY